MSMVAKILIFVNLVLAVLVMGAAGAYLQSAENWRTQFQSLKSTSEATIKDLNDSVNQANSQRDEATRKATAAIADRATFESANRTLQANNELLQKALNDVKTSLSGLEAKTGNLQQNLEAARAANENLQKEKTQADDEKRQALEAKATAETEQKRQENMVANLTAQLDASEKNKAQIAEELEKTSTILAIYKQKYPAPGMPAPPVKGMVLAADAKTGVYLISVGEKDGLLAAQELTISRGEKYVATVVVDKVMADKASVTVKRLGGKPLKAEGMEIQQGDKVVNSY